jgi:two-component system nitrogen regulation sensor histidine kinase GlnL
VKGAAQLLGRRVGDDASRELVGLIDGEVGRLTALLDQLLSPAPPRAHSALNIHAVLERVLRLAESDAGWAVKLLRDYDPSLPEFEGDADRLTQALWNLVRNAIEAGAGSITLRTRAEHGLRIGDALHPVALRLEVVDDGHGVPEALAEQIFLPLVSGRAEGSGLGLALAQQVAREHRGSLAWRSRPGHTVFTLLLPMVEPEDPE